MESRLAKLLAELSAYLEDKDAEDLRGGMSKDMPGAEGGGQPPMGEMGGHEPGPMDHALMAADQGGMKGQDEPDDDELEELAMMSK